MKILFFLPSFKTGGGNRVMIELAGQVVSAGNKAAIVFPNNSEDSNTFSLNPLVEIIYIGKFGASPIHKFYNLLLAIKWLRVNKKNDYLVYTDPIHSIFLTTFKKNTFRFVQADDYSLFDDGIVLKNKFFVYCYKKLCKICFKQNDNYIFNSEYSYKQFLAHSNRNNVQFRLVHPAINHQVFNYRKKKFGKIILAMVGRPHPIKGLKDFFEAWLELPAMFKERIEKISIISHDDLSAFSGQPKIEIIKPENDSDIAAVLQEAHIFVSTSWNEGFGLPGLEAMSCGCALITSCSGGVSEYAIDNKNCLMYKPKMISELVKKLIFLIDNPEKITELSQEAVRSSASFTWKNSYRQLINIVK